MPNRWITVVTISLSFIALALAVSFGPKALRPVVFSLTVTLTSESSRKITALAELESLRTTLRTRVIKPQEAIRLVVGAPKVDSYEGRYTRDVVLQAREFDTLIPPLVRIQRGVSGIAAPSSPTRSFSPGIGLLITIVAASLLSLGFLVSKPDPSGWQDVAELILNIVMMTLLAIKPFVTGGDVNSPLLFLVSCSYIAIVAAIWLARTRLRRTNAANDAFFPLLVTATVVLLTVPAIRSFTS